MYAPRLKICLSLRLQYEFAGTLGIFTDQAPASHARCLITITSAARCWREPSTYLALRAMDPLFVSRSLRGPGTVRPVLPQALGGAVPFLLDRPVSASAVCALRGLPRDALDLADRIGLAVDRQQRRRLREIDRTDDALNLFGNRDGIPRAICGGGGQLVLAVW